MLRRHLGRPLQELRLKLVSKLPARLRKNVLSVENSSGKTRSLREVRARRYIAERLEQDCLIALDQIIRDECYVVMVKFPITADV
ncbi:hypothetical protein TNCV_2940501 [Trichonephila clavipes]|nr:hypothetical protein TNCV_2940501 [Trichonephila clavipes]